MCGLDVQGVSVQGPCDADGVEWAAENPTSPAAEVRSPERVMFL